MCLKFNCMEIKMYPSLFVLALFLSCSQEDSLSQASDGLAADTVRDRC